MLSQVNGTSFGRPPTNPDEDKIKSIRNLPSLQDLRISAENLTAGLVTGVNTNTGNYISTLPPTGRCPEKLKARTRSVSCGKRRNPQLPFTSPLTGRKCCSTVSVLRLSSWNSRTDETCSIVEGGTKTSLPDDPMSYTIPDSHSIEIFFGRIVDLNDFYNILVRRYPTVPEVFSGNAGDGSIEPDSVKKLVLVGNPLPSFSGLNNFISLSDVWITDCNTSKVLWSDFEGLDVHRIYLSNCNIQHIEPFRFQNLKGLWLTDNKISSLKFLSYGLPRLEEVGLGNNKISCIQISDIVKCPNIRKMNLSGNLLHTPQDISALKVLPNLVDLHFNDPIYGKCPVSSQCDSRTVILSMFQNLKMLDGTAVEATELEDSLDYVTTRALYFYAHSVRAISTQSVFRRTAIMCTVKKLDAITYRIQALMSLGFRYRRILSTVQVIPIFTHAKNLMREQAEKIEHRVRRLKHWTAIILRRLEVVMGISRWEQEAEKWIKWIEFQSYGNTKCHMLHSVHGPLIGHPNELCASIHELLSSLSCPGLWPHDKIGKLETVIVIRDVGMEAALQKTYEEYFAPKDEPEFIMPEESPTQVVTPPPCNRSRFNDFPAPRPTTPPVTYMSPDWEPRPPLRPFPESIMGLPEKAQPIFLFVICPASYAANPVGYLHKIVNEKAVDIKNIKLTNCIWAAVRQKVVSFAVLIVVKVLQEAIQLTKVCKHERGGPDANDNNASKHGFDCARFSVTTPLAISPAYIVTLSFTPQADKATWKTEFAGQDEDVLQPARTALATLTDKILRHGQATPPLRPGQSKKAQFHHKTSNGRIVVDLSGTLMHMNEEGDIRFWDWSEPITCTPAIHSISKFFGPDVSHAMTALDLSGNKLGNLLGLEDLPNLRKLNLTHNKLKNVNGICKLPNLIELKIGWNCLSNLHNTIFSLQSSTPRLKTLDVLPNSFQDIREFRHIPVIVKRYLSSIKEIDSWIGMTSQPPQPIPKFTPGIPDAEFTHVAMSDSWRSYYPYNAFASKWILDLDGMPATPPLPEGWATDGIELNLSDNYLSSTALENAKFVLNLEWRCVILKLELHENNIKSLSWLSGHPFPNLRVLNLANNMVEDVEEIPSSCQNLCHLILCGNPLPRESGVLYPLRLLKNLVTLDCTGAPVTSHPEYSVVVSKHLASVKILDGIPMAKWQVISQVENAGGIVTQDWLEDRLSLSCRDWSKLTQLSLPNSNLQKISLPGHVLPKLKSLDLTGNHLNSFTSLCSLPDLKVLCMSHNKISYLGNSTCPTCFSNTVQSQIAGAQRSLNDSPSNAHSGNSPVSSSRKGKTVFPRLEILILTHNDLASVEELHLHAFPRLDTLLLNCNKLTSFNGLENLPTVRAVVLDCNKIRDVPFNCLVGCKSLRYLHLEHNRLTSVPRLPHLENLTALHLGYNKIQSLTDMSCISNLLNLSMTENPLTRRPDYRFRVAACLPLLSSLDGKDVTGERLRLNELKRRWFPGGIGKIDKTPFFEQFTTQPPEYRPPTQSGTTSSKKKKKNRRGVKKS